MFFLKEEAPLEKLLRKMKEKFFSIIWAALCAWIITYVLLKIDASYNISDMYFFPSVFSFIQGFCSVRKLVFFLLTIIFVISGIHKGVGKILLFIIGVVALVVIVALVIMVAWWFFDLLANSL